MTAEADRQSVGGSERLPPSEMAARLDRILSAGERMIALVPDPQADDGSHGRDRTARQVAYLMFRDSLAFADAMDMGRLPPEWLQANMPRDLRDGCDVARYGALVRGRLSGWFEGAAPAEYSRTIDTDRGLETGHALLERTMQGAAERLHELRALIGDFGLRPDDKP